MPYKIVYRDDRQDETIADADDFTMMSEEWGAFIQEIPDLGIASDGKPKGRVFRYIWLGNVQDIIDTRTPTIVESA